MSSASVKPKGDEYIVTYNTNVLANQTEQDRLIKHKNSVRQTAATAQDEKVQHTANSMISDDVDNSLASYDDLQYANKIINRQFDSRIQATNQQRLQELLHKSSLLNHDTLPSLLALSQALRNAQRLQTGYLLAEWDTLLYWACGEEVAEQIIKARLQHSQQQKTALTASNYRAANAEIQQDEEDNNPLSSWQIAEKVSKSIGAMNESYLSIFQHTLEKYAAFFGEFSNLVTRMNECITVDGETTVLDAKKFKGEIAKLKKQYDSNLPNKNATLYPVQTGNGQDRADETASKEACVAWARQLGLDPDRCVKQVDGEYVVTLDTSPLDAIEQSLKGDKMKMNSAQWAAWQTGFDQQKNILQTAMQTLTQKYSSANATFEQLIKVLSSTISALLETDKAFLTI